MGYPGPGPLPWEEGEWSSASRSSPCRNLPNDHRLSTNQTPAVPSPKGEGQGEGKYSVEHPKCSISQDASVISEFACVVGFTIVDSRKKCCPDEAFFATNRITGQS